MYDADNSIVHLESMTTPIKTKILEERKRQNHNRKESIKSSVRKSRVFPECENQLALHGNIKARTAERRTNIK